jgi:hypothetical protein
MTQQDGEDGYSIPSGKARIAAIREGRTPKEFVSLRDLFNTRECLPGTLATAIERHGIHGWDRYFRWRYFEASSPDALRGLDVVAGLTGQAIVDINGDGNDHAHFWGWPADQLPDLDAIQAEDVAGAPVPQPPQPSRRSEDATLAIVGALLDFIKGKVGESRKTHPSYESEAQLAELIAGELGEFPGLSKSNLQKKFTLAKKLIQSPPD